MYRSHGSMAASLTISPKSLRVLWRVSHPLSRVPHDTPHRPISFTMSVVSAMSSRRSSTSLLSCFSSYRSKSIRSWSMAASLFSHIFVSSNHCFSNSRRRRNSFCTSIRSLRQK